MFGKTSKGRPHHVCCRDDVHRDADWFDQHPKALWVSEKILVNAVHWFFGERVLGPRRTELLRAQPATSASAADADDVQKTEKLREEIKAIERRKRTSLG